MFARFITLASIVALVAAGGSSSSVCSTGEQNCCTQKFSGPTPFSRGDSSDGSSSGVVTAVVGAVLNAGLTCTPITVLGLTSGAQCQTQAACCSNVKQTGLINVACTPAAIAAA